MKSADREGWRNGNEKTSTYCCNSKTAVKNKTSPSERQYTMSQGAGW